MNMRLFRSLLLCFAALVLVPGAAARNIDYSDLRVHGKGLGPAELGMKVPEVSEALGIALREEAIKYTDEECSSYALGASPYEWDLRFIAEDNELVKIDIFTEQIRTQAGVGVGSGASAIREAYDTDFRVLPGRDKGESKLQTRTDADTVLEFVGRRPGPAQGDGSGERAPPEKVRRYSIGLIGSGATEGCL